MKRDDMIWYDMIWYDMIWYDIFSDIILSTCMFYYIYIYFIFAENSILFHIINRPHRIVGQPLVTANDVGHWDQKHPKVLIVGKKKREEFDSHV